MQNTIRCISHLLPPKAQQCSINLIQLAGQASYRRRIPMMPDYGQPAPVILA
jgi:hypothetical protein